MAMLTSKFIGREAQLQQLRDLAMHAIDNHGNTLFIQATAGMGTGTLLKEFEERKYNDPELHDAVFINVELEPFGVKDAYSPIVEILEGFGKPKLVNYLFHEL